MAKSFFLRRYGLGEVKNSPKPAMNRQERGAARKRKKKKAQKGGCTEFAAGGRTAAAKIARRRGTTYNVDGMRRRTSW